MTTFTCSAGGNGGTFVIDSSSLRWLVTDQFPYGTCETDVSRRHAARSQAVRSHQMWCSSSWSTEFTAVSSHNEFIRNCFSLTVRSLHRHLRTSLIRYIEVNRKKKEGKYKQIRKRRVASVPQSRDAMFCTSSMNRSSQTVVVWWYPRILWRDVSFSLSSLIISFCFSFLFLIAGNRRGAPAVPGPRAITLTWRSTSTCDDTASSLTYDLGGMVWLSGAAAWWRRRGCWMPDAGVDQSDDGPAWVVSPSGLCRTVRASSRVPYGTWCVSGTVLASDALGSSRRRGRTPHALSG